VVFRHAPDVPGEVLSVFGLTSRMGILLEQDEVGHVDRSADRFLPTHRSLVEGHEGGVGLELNTKPEANLARPQTLAEIGAEICWIRRRAGDGVGINSRFKFILDETLAAESKRHATPIIDA
jgi:hypothetical protein